MKLVFGSSGTEYPLEEQEITIGRGLQNAVQIDDPRASREHARISPGRKGFVLEDLNSSNGTYVNRKRISKRHQLAHGDEIIIGNTHFSVIDTSIVEPFAHVIPGEDWQTLRFAPLWVLTAVTEAHHAIDAQGLDALARALSEANTFNDRLVREVLMSVAADIDSVMEAFEPDMRTTDEGLRDIVAVLDGHIDEPGRLAFTDALLYIGHDIVKAIPGDDVQHSLLTISRTLSVHITD